MMKKPRLSLGSSNEESPTPGSARPKLGVKPESKNPVHKTRSTGAALAGSFGRLLKAVAFILAFGLIVLAVLYSSLSATLMFTAPSNDDHTNRIWVTRGAFEGGIAPVDAYVYGSTTQAAEISIPGKALEGYTGSADYFVAKIIAGPYGDVGSTSDGFVTIEGKKTAYKGTVENQKLNKVYLGVCEEGNCVPGEVVQIPQANIAGEAKGYIDLMAMTFQNYDAAIGNEQSDVK